MPSNKVKAKAKTGGVSNMTLWRANELLDIKASKERGSGEWCWRLSGDNERDERHESDE